MNRVLYNVSKKNVIKHLNNVNGIQKAEQIQLIRLASTKNLDTTKTNVLNVSTSSNTSTANNSFSTGFGQEPWSMILSKAEKVVGYPTSFLNLRYLLSRGDEVAYFAMLLRY